MSPKGLSAEEKKVFFLHLGYSLIEGILLGAFILNEFVFLKSLDGSNFQLGVLFQFKTAVFVIAIFITELVKRYKKSHLLRTVAFVTRLPLLLIFFFPTTHTGLDDAATLHYTFLLIFLLFYSGQPVIYPAINHYLKKVYKGNHFGKLYGYAKTAHKIVMLLTTFGFGLLLDMDNFAFVYIYPGLSAFGIISVFMLAAMDKYADVNNYSKKPIWASVKESYQKMIDIIKFNKPYRDFEIAFMLYGFAFMFQISVVTIFMVDFLDLSYSGIAFYKNMYNIIAILMLPAFGKLMDKIDPRQFAIITFASLATFIFFVMLTEYFPWHTEIFGIQFYYVLFIGYLSYSFFAAAMGIVWSIGSAYFCKPEEAGDYQSVHLTMVGFRALFAPLFGVWIYELFGFTVIFSLAILSLLLGISALMISRKRYHLSMQH